jgi:tyrosinase
MTASRREILLQGCAIGAGVIAANVPGIVALAQAGPFLRRSLHGMADNDPILEAWRDGVRLLKARPASNPVSWANFAAIHGDANSFNLCPHGNWYFLPWHRAYLLTYERAVRQLTGHNDFALPYWDWTQDRQMPSAFVQPMFNGMPNSLFESQRDATPTDSLPDTTVGPAVINQILADAPFETFATSRPVGQNDLSQSWINAEFSGTLGKLEQTPHNLVHVFVGGIMGQANSALDPIFMMHHCNIDRIWWLWNQGGQVDSPDPLWSGMTIQNNFFNPDGTPYSPKVSDLLVPETLGYTYDTTLPPAGGSPPAGGGTPPPVVVAQYEKLKSLYAVPNLTTAKAAGITAYVAPNTLTATAAKYLEVPVEVGANELNTVARRQSLPSGFAALNLGRAREAAVRGPRAYAFLRDIDYAEHENTEYRVFINCDYLSPETPHTDRSYVGSFGFFGGHGSHGGREARKPSIAVDLTSAIQRVYGSAEAPAGRLRVQVQPVALRPKGKQGGTATPSRVEVAFVSG